MLQCLWYGVCHWGSHIRGSFHIGQIGRHGEGADIGCNGEDIDGVRSEGVSDKHVDDSGYAGGNKDGDSVNTGMEDSENQDKDGSSKDEVGEHIEEGEGVLVYESDGKDNEGDEDGLVDNVGERIGVHGGCSVRGVGGGHGEWW